MIGAWHNCNSWRYGCGGRVALDRNAKLLIASQRLRCEVDRRAVLIEERGEDLELCTSLRRMIDRSRTS